MDLSCHAFSVCHGFWPQLVSLAAFLATRHTSLHWVVPASSHKIDRLPHYRWTLWNFSAPEIPEKRSWSHRCSGNKIPGKLIPFCSLWWVFKRIFRQFFASLWIHFRPFWPRILELFRTIWIFFVLEIPTKRSNSHRCSGNKIPGKLIPFYWDEFFFQLGNWRLQEQ